jgi:hypothetical protein
MPGLYALAFIAEELRKAAGWPPPIIPRATSSSQVALDENEIRVLVLVQEVGKATGAGRDLPEVLPLGLVLDN